MQNTLSGSNASKHTHPHKRVRTPPKKNITFFQTDGTRNQNFEKKKKQVFNHHQAKIINKCF